MEALTHLRQLHQSSRCRRVFLADPAGRLGERPNRRRNDGPELRLFVTGTEGEPVLQPYMSEIYEDGARAEAGGGPWAMPIRTLNRPGHRDHHLRAEPGHAPDVAGADPDSRCDLFVATARASSSFTAPGRRGSPPDYVDIRWFGACSRVTDGVASWRIPSTVR